jgi:outer membrane immunogenic protein
VVAAGGNVYDVVVAGQASMHVVDFATLRARAGFEAYNFLPYVTAGISVGRADLVRSASVSGQQNPPPPTSPPTPCGPPQSPTCLPFAFFESEAKNGAYIYGWSLGGGVDVFVLPHVFLRLEYEYVGFVPVMTTRRTLGTYQRILPRTMQPSCLPHPPSPVFRS